MNKIAIFLTLMLLGLSINAGSTTTEIGTVKELYASYQECECNAEIISQDLYNGLVTIYNSGNCTASCILTYEPMRGGATSAEFTVGPGETYVFCAYQQIIFSAELYVIGYF